jgi:hypothetical protein
MLLQTACSFETTLSALGTTIQRAEKKYGEEKQDL